MLEMSCFSQKVHNHLAYLLHYEEECRNCDVAFNKEAHGKEPHFLYLSSENVTEQRSDEFQLAGCPHRPQIINPPKGELNLIMPCVIPLFLLHSELAFEVVPIVFSRVLYCAFYFA